MYEAMYRLLNVSSHQFCPLRTQLSFERTMKAIYQHQFITSELTEISAAVVQAYNTLIDPNKRAYYNRFGKPSPYESYNNRRALELAVLRKQIVDRYDRQEMQRISRLQDEAHRAMMQEEEQASREEANRQVITPSRHSITPEPEERSDPHGWVSSLNQNDDNLLEPQDTSVGRYPRLRSARLPNVPNSARRHDLGTQTASGNHIWGQSSGLHSEDPITYETDEEEFEAGSPLPDRASSPDNDPPPTYEEYLASSTSINFLTPEKKDAATSPVCFKSHVALSPIKFEEEDALGMRICTCSARKRLFSDVATSPIKYKRNFLPMSTTNQEGRAFSNAPEASRKRLCTGINKAELDEQFEQGNDDSF